MAKKAIDWGLVRQYLRSRYLPFVTGIGVSLATVLTIGLVQGAGSQGAPDVAKAPVESGSLVAIERIEREMELMKKIVSGLVQSVQTLSKEGALKETDVYTNTRGACRPKSISLESSKRCRQQKIALQL